MGFFDILRGVSKCVRKTRLLLRREEVVKEISKTRLKLSMSNFKLCQLTKKKSALEIEMEEMEDRTDPQQPMWIQDVEVDPPMMDVENEPAESKIFKDLTCEKCDVIMRDTMVYSCTNCHQICTRCLPRLQNCPLCHTKAQRNQPVEAIIAHLFELLPNNQ